MIELRTCIFARRRLPESLICNLLLLWLGASEASEAHTSHEWTVRGARDCHCLPIPEMYAAPKMLLVMLARCQPGQTRRHPCLSANPESSINVRHAGRKVYTNTECGVGHMRVMHTSFLKDSTLRVSGDGKDKFTIQT